MKELSKLKEDLAKLLEEHQQVMGERAPLEEQVQQLKSELESASQTIDSHTATIEQQKQRNKALVEDISRLRTELEEASSKTAQAMNSLHMSRSMCLGRSSSSLSGASAAGGAGELHTSTNEIEVLLETPDGEPAQDTGRGAGTRARLLVTYNTFLLLFTIRTSHMMISPQTHTSNSDTLTSELLFV